MNATPFTRTERRAMRAVATLVDLAGGPEAFAETHGLNERTVKRIRAGQQPPPLGLARELLAALDALPFDLQLQHAQGHLAAFIAQREAMIEKASQ